ncbi:DUF4238 domain-containing protein [Deinococcus radiodurans]|jgi:hypothetical protein|nr:DUF4238 domain-containing protein [Deinococcus radiodurans]QEM72609.1 DUF4238 domain-containing protein [Deinococcus radiodurans]QIP32470.1 DUF4238 domain-containing protein [Deinococcus radiodurans]UDK99840.1 DUF4238 domain-containing protein [Deinococcus radiodurans R1 = ATCC 13939 = DSM 20539]UID69664.1 hypothetical protein DRO_0662 [Deinococcus radiodurans R1 = ATCC 13939 = DSM 20539]
MANNEPIRHHWVPQYYLREFCDSDGKLFVLDKTRKKTFKTSPEGIAVERNFHTVDIKGVKHDDPYYLEKQISDNFEAIHSRFIRDLTLNLDAKHRFMNHNHKSMLAEIVGLQLLRTPRIREQTFDLAAREVGQPGTTLSQDDFAKITHLIMLDNNISSSLPKIKGHLSNFTFQFLEVPSDSPYITSDVPVITGITDCGTGKMSLTMSQGIGKDGAELYFPLTKKYLLVMGKSILGDKIRDCQIRQMNAKYSDEFNSMMQVACDNQIYSSFYIGI